MEREKDRRDWRTVTVNGDGSVANVKTNQTKLEAELCLARSRLVNPAGSYTTLNDWTPRDERKGRMTDEERNVKVETQCRACEYRSHRALSCGKIADVSCRTRGESDVVWGMVVKVVLQGRRVALFNEEGGFLIAFPVTPHLQDTVCQYLEDHVLKVSNADTFPYLQKFAAETGKV